MKAGFRFTAALLALILAGAVLTAQRRDVFVASRDHAAIAYSRGPTSSAVDQLQQKIADGTIKLSFDPVSGYLRSVLAALSVPVESQALVFSQTSLQAPKIHYENPRAVFFNDSVSIGWVRGGDIVEVAALDPRQGVIFYTIDQQETAKPKVERDDSCLACHLSWESAGVPGLLVQSVHPLPDEKSYVNGYTTIHGSPLEQRWGGWYVTGNHGGARHMGNIPVMPADKGKRKLANPRQPLKTVEGLFELTGYPTPHSDVVAMMVLAHQTQMSNLIIRLGWESRVAAANPSPDATARSREAAAELVDYMLFVYEAPLTGPMQDSSGFVKVFSGQGPRDQKGRSLREFDLRKRMFRYPCSYMIYTEAFDALPPAAAGMVYQRLWDVLSGGDKHQRYRVLSAADRQAIIQILRETKPNLPAYFKAS